MQPGSSKYKNKLRKELDWQLMQHRQMWDTFSRMQLWWQSREQMVIRMMFK